MSKLKRIKDILKQHKQELKDNFKLKNIGVFGSYIRKESNRKSDLDILVEFEEMPDLLRFIELEEYLSSTIGIKVDLVMKKSLKPDIKKYILREVIYI